MEEGLLYEEILQRMLDQVPEGIDKREGSVIYDALAPAAVEFLLMYQALDQIMEETYVDTASMEGLKKRCKERGVQIKGATNAVIRGSFIPASVEIPIGHRFNCGSVNYVTKEKEVRGRYLLECETPGADGNLYEGQLIPIHDVNGLKNASIEACLILGEDEDTEEELRTRYFASVDSQAFGGNQTDYREKVSLLNGVGGVKVERAWNSDLRPEELIPPDSFEEWMSGQVQVSAGMPQQASQEMPQEIKTWLETVAAAAKEKLLTVGGTVKLTIITSDYTAPSQELIQQVQTAVDPVQTAGEGMGFAPIGHVVTVHGAQPEPVTVETMLTYVDGWNWESSKSLIESAIDEYLMELRKTWEAEPSLVVRISQIENKLLSLPCTLDITDTTINGIPQNYALTANHIPVRGTVSQLGGL